MHSNAGLTQNSKDSKCPYCDGTGWILRSDEKNVDIVKPCECRIKEIARRKLNFAELPESFRTMELKNFQINVYQTPEGKRVIGAACKAIKYYLDNFLEMKQLGMGVYLYSKTKGSGKTRMAIGIGNELLKHYSIKFATSTRILNEIKATWRNRREEEYSENKLLNSLIQVEILIIDDFGAEKIADWINDRFYHIINERYINKKVTLFTSNESLETLAYDERIINRMKERTYQIQFPEESIREYISKENNMKLLKKLGGI